MEEKSKDITSQNLSQMILLAQIYASQEYTRERTYIHTIVNYFLEGNMQTWVLLEIIM